MWLSDGSWSETLCVPTYPSGPPPVFAVAIPPTHFLSEIAEAIEYRARPAHAFIDDRQFRGQIYAVPAKLVRIRVSSVFVP